MRAAGLDLQAVAGRGAVAGAPRTSAWDKKAGEFSKVAENSGYTGYRFHVQLVTELFTPDGERASWNAGFRYVASGDVIDVATQNKVATWEATAVATRRDRSAKVTTFIGTVVAHFENGDSLTFAGVLKISNTSYRPVSSSLTCTGGSGRYLGAFGEAVLTRSGAYSIKTEGIVSVYVPTNLPAL